MMPDFMKMGYSVCLVAYDSRNPAVMKMGMSPTTSFIPFLAPCLKDSSLVKVPGKRILLPITIPAPPAITIAEISRVP